MDVLLVDDEPLMLEQLEILITPVCPMWNLYTAEDSSQAVELTNRRSFTLAILDIQLPGKSGLELAKMLKNQNEKLEIIILSAHQDFQYAKQSITIGVSHYLTKPIIKDELYELLHYYKQTFDQQRYSDMIVQVLNYIHEHYRERITLADVAATIHVNQSYLSRKFKIELTLSFSEYLTNYRIEMAKELFTTKPQLSISDIAEQTGFSSLHYFSTIFRKNVGVSPKQYRNLRI